LLDRVFKRIVITVFRFHLAIQIAHLLKNISLTKKITRKLFLVLPILSVLFITLIIVYASILIDLQSVSFVPYVKEGETKAILLNTLFFIFIVTFGLFFTYFILKKGWIAILEKMFGIGGGLLTITLTGIISMNIYDKFPLMPIFVLVWLFTFVIGLSVVFTVFGIFSEELRNIMYMIYSAVVGSLLGMGIPLYSMVNILLSICAIDLLAFRTGFLDRIADLSRGEAIFFHLKHSDLELMIGWGDLLYYSSFASYSISNFGIPTATFSIVLILFGWVFTLYYTTRKRIFAGLPVPVILGLIPIMINLDPVYFFSLIALLGLDRLVMLAKPKLSRLAHRLEKPLISPKIDVPRHPKIRMSIGLIALVAIFVITPLALVPLQYLGFSLQNTSVATWNWLLVSSKAYELLFTHYLFIPFVYTGIVNGVYLVTTRKIKRIFPVILLIFYLVSTTIMIPVQLYLLEFFTTFISILPLYVIVTLSLVYSVTETSTIDRPD